jgi:hypothetical protein
MAKDIHLFPPKMKIMLLRCKHWNCLRSCIAQWNFGLVRMNWKCILYEWFGSPWVLVVKLISKRQIVLLIQPYKINFKAEYKKCSLFRSNCWLNLNGFWSFMLIPWVTLHKSKCHVPDLHSLASEQSSFCILIYSRAVVWILVYRRCHKCYSLVNGHFMTLFG